MNFKIGVFGSAVTEKEETIQKTKALARVLAEQKDITLVTGACSGIPYMVAEIVAKKGIPVIGFSPTACRDDQIQAFPNDDISLYKELEYIPADYKNVDMREVRLKYRNVSSTAFVDAGIIIAGRWGTLNEFTNLIDMGKVIGVLTGTGGIADELPALTQKIKKENKGTVIFSDSPEELVQKVLSELTFENRRLK